MRTREMRRTTMFCLRLAATSGLLHVRVLGFGLLQNGNVAVGVFPERASFTRHHASVLRLSAGPKNKPVFAAVNRCATQNQDRVSWTAEGGCPYVSWASSSWARLLFPLPQYPP